MNVKQDVEEFLRLYAKLTGSVLRESDGLFYIELSPVEKRKHLLSQLKFSFSRDVCELENAEFLTSTNPTYRALLTEAKNVGVVAVAKSAGVRETVVVIGYQLTLGCQNHVKEELREIAIQVSDSAVVPIPEFWSEARPSEAAGVSIAVPELTETIREGILQDISDPLFRFTDEMDRRQDRERSMVREFFTQQRKERENVVLLLEEEISQLQTKMENTNSMKVYDSSKGQIEKLRQKIINLENTKARDLKRIAEEFELASQRVTERFSIETHIDLLNALIVLPTK